MNAWEYKMTQVWKKAQDLGEEGWEMFSVGQVDSGFVYFLKREIQKKMAKQTDKPLPLQIEDEFGTYNFGDTDE